MGRRAIERRLAHKIRKLQRRERIIEKKIGRAEKKGKFVREEHLKSRLERVERKEAKIQDKLDNLDERIRRHKEKMKKTFKGGKKGLHWIATHSPFLIGVVEVLADVSATLIIAAAVAGTGGLGLGAGILAVQSIESIKAGLETAIAASVAADTAVSGAEAVAKSIKEKKRAHEVIRLAGEKIAEVGEATGNDKYKDISNNLKDVADMTADKVEEAEPIYKALKAGDDIGPMGMPEVEVAPMGPPEDLGHPGIVIKEKKDPKGINSVAPKKKKAKKKKKAAPKKKTKKPKKKKVKS